MSIFNRLPRLFRTVALILISAFCGSVWTGAALAEPQPNMVSAKAAIQRGIDYLNLAVEDKGGHRTQAINFARRAIHQINLGIGYADTH